MYFKRYTDHSDTPVWGGATYYFQTDDSGRAEKELAVYDNGNIRKYDHAHPSDEYGSLPDDPLFTDDHSRGEWQDYQISEQEFLSAWQDKSRQANQNALEAIYRTGKWAIILGVLNFVIPPLFAYYLYNSTFHGLSKLFLIVVSAFFGLILGGGFIVLGGRLRRTNFDELGLAEPELHKLRILIFLVIIFSILSGGGVGLLSLWLLYLIVSANEKIGEANPEYETSSVGDSIFFVFFITVVMFSAFGYVNHVRGVTEVVIGYISGAVISAIGLSLAVWWAAKHNDKFRKKSRKYSILFGVFIVMASLASLLWGDGIFPGLINMELKRHGQQVQASVVSYELLKENDTNTKSTTYYKVYDPSLADRVLIDLSYDGRSEKLEAKRVNIDRLNRPVFTAFAEDVEAGKMVTVRYLPSAPYIVRTQLELNP